MKALRWPDSNKETCLRGIKTVGICCVLGLCILLGSSRIPWWGWLGPLRQVELSVSVYLVGPKSEAGVFTVPEEWNEALTKCKQCWNANSRSLKVIESVGEGIFYLSIHCGKEQEYYCEVQRKSWLGAVCGERQNFRLLKLEPVVRNGV